MEIVNHIFETEILKLGSYTLKVSQVFSILIIIVTTKTALWLIRHALFRKYKFKNIDKGTTYAIFQIIKYVLWVMAIALGFEALGIKVTLLLAGSAALLVGIGLGLQQTFNDVISGIILLSERSIKIGDVLEIDSDVVKIESIGLRTSKAINRDDISIIIPNSLITTSKVINWSHQSHQARFKIDVGVAYGSDVDKVIKILEESAFEHPEIHDIKLVEARLLNFGNSSLDFQLLFFSSSIFRIGKVKSDIRRIINKKFNEHQITIPFPQMDLHFRSNENDK
ncbi:mechanosensitive ion channel family protein [Maribacter sp. ACAM166]|uniref:mechanosensitive ion channel family protein n=1 Tax=Maribacter sp. ACAM166 TaxID=2508996 RepID=UPI0010FEEEAC|nr:mechanosensitive ion channel domain-containing protein [Maribacter sp. ACAM166]TLP80166.1 mechanosensitive ion channel [Maribacter sp. ACAM166]